MHVFLIQDVKLPEVKEWVLLEWTSRVFINKLRILVGTVAVLTPRIQTNFKNIKSVWVEV